MIAILASTGAKAQQPDLVIANVNVVDVENGVLLPDRTVSISNGVIASIDGGEVANAASAEIVDGTGRYLIPGLIDMHVHTAREGLPILLEYGVTTIRDMGTHFAPLEPEARGQLAMRSEIENGALVGPEMFLALRILDGAVPRNPRFAMHYAAVATPAEGRSLVDQVADAGGDFVKVYTDLDPDVFEAIVDQSKKRNLKFAGHVPGQVGYVRAAEAGIHTVEHLRGIFIDLSSEEERWRAGFTEAAATLTATATYQFTNANIPAMAATYDEAKAQALFATLRENRVGVVPTLVVLDDPRWRYPSARPDPAIVERLGPIYSRIVSVSGRSAFPHDSVADAQLSYQLRSKLVGDMHRAGVDILVGTDYANPFVLPGVSMHEELGNLVRAGFSPADALKAATFVNARYLDAQERIGSIAEGKEADLVLLDANPLEDIAATRQIAAVYVNGKRFEQVRDAQD
ncbi:MAG: amidohydrolase family protein [Erythrobacter sp.]|nr:amidohydrolase family protein [Erythrobacter sp.]